MKKRSWSNKDKWMIVLEGIKGRAINEICLEHGITQSLYYKWRDQFMSNGPKLFDVSNEAQRQSILERENERLKNLVGELSLELKKNENYEKL